MGEKELLAQTNFSGGQINPAAKRREDLDAVKTGARQMQNWRIEAVGTLVQRPGRTAVFPPKSPRAEQIRMSPSQEFFLAFSTGTLRIFDLAGNLVAGNASAAYVWTDATVANIHWAQAVFDVMICFEGVPMRPQIARFNPVTGTWSFLPFSFRSIASALQEPFNRFSVPGATLTPSAQTGAITLACSQDYFSAPLIGSVLSILGQQVIITGVTNPRLAAANVIGQLPAWISIPVSTTVPFQPGQIVETVTSQVKLEVGSVGGGVVTGTMMSPLVPDASTFPTTDTLVSPIGSSAVTVAPTIIGTGQPTVQWLEEFMSALRGWPQSCAFDLARLSFMDFPQQPEAVLWSAINAADVFWVDSSAAANNAAAGTAANAAMLEFIPGKPRVRHLVGWGDEFIFTDRGIYFVPLSAAVGGGALAPGSVSFRQFSNDGVSGMRPLTTQDAIVYVNAGRTRVSAVKATGQLTRPYVSQDASEAYQPLFTGPVAMAIATGDGEFPERYVYVVNADGTLIVGKFTPDQQFVGWVPWLCAGATRWVTAAGPSVWTTALYGSTYVLESEDPSSFLDGGVLLAAPAPGMGNAPLGPLWHLAGMTVAVMDGARDLGDRTVSADGHIVPLSPADDLSGPTLIAGLFSPAVFEPFVQSTPPGQDRRQRQKRRRMPRVGLVVEQSSGFSFGREVIPPTGFDEDPTAQPVLRETTYVRSFLMPTGTKANQGRGKDFDPSIVITKDRPGPMRVVEINFEVGL